MAHIKEIVWNCFTGTQKPLRQLATSDYVIDVLKYNCIVRQGTYVLVASGKTCNTEDLLGYFLIDRDQACSDACFDKPGCRFFTI